MPEVWSIDKNGTISRQCKLSLTKEGLLGLSSAAKDSFPRQLADGSEGQSQPTAFKNNPNTPASSQYRQIRADPVGVWGSASFVGHDEKLVACAEGGELVP